MSIFAWIDYDDEQRKHINEIIKIFSESDTRDELGLGVISGALADLFFPGTSTIQTRVRYMLFIPWIFMKLEEKRIGSNEFLSKSEKDERALIEQLKELNEWGIFGRRRLDIKRLPSSVYWQGLRDWGIRLFSGAIGEYGSSIDNYYVKVDNFKGEEEEKLELQGFYNWDPEIPKRPANFPEGIIPGLERDEAIYLMERIKFKQPASLFARLLDHPGQIDVDYIWAYPNLNIFTSEQKHWIENARLFSKIMYGAILLYNVSIAELIKEDGGDKGKEWSKKYRREFDLWHNSIKDEFSAVKRWDLDGFWRIVDLKAKGNYVVAKLFVRRWVDMVFKSDATGLIDDPTARQLIADREEALKHGQSRIISEQARKRWNGDVGSGTRAYNFRWPITQNFLNEIFEGLK